MSENTRLIWMIIIFIPSGEMIQLIIICCAFFHLIQISVSVFSRTDENGKFFSCSRCYIHTRGDDEKTIEIKCWWMGKKSSRFESFLRFSWPTFVSNVIIHRKLKRVSRRREFKRDSNHTVLEVKWHSSERVTREFTFPLFSFTNHLPIFEHKIKPAA